MGTDKWAQQQAQFDAWKRTGKPLCANFDTDRDVSACETPYDDVVIFTPRIAPRTPVALCNQCRFRAVARDRQELDKRHGDYAYLYDGFPLD